MVDPDLAIVKPEFLEGRIVRLDPLRADHVDQLCHVGLNPSLWQVTATRLSSREDMIAYIASALRQQSEGTCLPFAIFHKADGQYVGSTRLANMDRQNRRAEIGWSWVAPRWQRTAVNTECKYLLLCHAFETLRCVRVELKTDALNQRSRKALLRIGAKEEGTLRSHMIVHGGRVRDTVYFSIIEQEWADVKRALEARLDRTD
jgi:RimJ/RimL family protein N-acetyltransferase